MAVDLSSTSPGAPLLRTRLAPEPRVGECVFFIAPTAQDLFRAAAIPQRPMPAAIVLRDSTFTMSARPGAPSIQNTIPTPFFGTTPFAAPGLGVLASPIMLGIGLRWLALLRPRASPTTSNL